MEYLRKQMSALLFDAAKKGIEKLDKKSSAAKDLKKLDIDTILKNDIDKVSRAISVPEILRCLALASELKVFPGNVKAKEEIKRIARDVYKRVEKTPGGLEIPKSYRELLFNL
ncbi:MAG: hypothetical protein HQL28_06935 [Candidatus Omnitrophica bacterium]|nr:hypothetical protein [Candidatus Omnitrophota bacterium]